MKLKTIGYIDNPIGLKSAFTNAQRIKMLKEQIEAIEFSREILRQELLHKKVKIAELKDKDPNEHESVGPQS